MNEFSKCAACNLEAVVEIEVEGSMVPLCAECYAEDQRRTHDAKGAADNA